MIRFLQGDCREVLKTLPDQSIQCVVTSPPYYGLRDYGTGAWSGGDADCIHQKVIDPIAAVATSTLGDGKKTTGHLQEGYGASCSKCGATRIDSQIGLEASPAAYVAEMVTVFREVWRVLRDDGAVWLNLGSSYASGGKRSTQSRASARAPACDTDGTGQPDSQGPDCACSDPCDGHRDDSQTHPRRTPDNDRSTAQSASQPSLTDRDSGTLDCVEASPGASLPYAHASTTPALPLNVPVGTDLSATASASQKSPLTCAAGVLSSAHKAQSSPDTEPLVETLAGHKSDRAPSSTTCNCGSCGICWSYLAIPLLHFKAKDLMEMPHLVALALQADGWFLRSDICWSKANPMPESVTDRPTSSYEHIFLLTKRERYFYDNEAIRETSGGWEDVSGVTRKISPISEGQGQRQTLPVVGETQSRAQAVLRKREGQGRNSALPGDGERHSVAEPRLPQATGVDGDRQYRNSGGVGHDKNDGQEQMPLLPESIQATDEGPRDPDHEGRGEHSFQRRSGVSELQSQEGEPATPSSLRKLRPSLPKGSFGGKTADQEQPAFRADYGSRNARNVWTIATAPFSEAHFATFPPELVERCVKAGTSEKGCCLACGAPWVRLTTKGEPDEAHRAASGADKSGGYNGRSTKDHDSHSVQNASDVKRRILEGMRMKTHTWQQGCACAATGIAPCTVLDPFSGAGTTALVADRLGRNAIGIDLNAEYGEMARQRLVADAGLFAQVAAE